MGVRTEDHGAAQVRTGTLADVVESLGNHTLRVITAPQGLGATISGTVLYDRFEALPQGRGALLFASGLRESDPGWLDLIERAAVGGYSGVVMKRWSGDTRLLLAAASASNLTLLSTPVQTQWRDLDALVTGLIAARGMDIGSATGDNRELLVLANSIAAQVGGSVAIEDLDRRILEYSSIHGQPIDAVRQAGILAHQVPDVPSNLAQYRLLLAAEGIVHFDESGAEMARSAVTIRAGSRPLGTIWVIEKPGGLSAEGRAALLGGAPLAALHLLLARHTREQDGNARSTALLAALDGLWSADDGTFRFLPPGGTDFALIGFASFSQATPAGGASDPTIAPISAMLTRYFAAFCPDASVATTSRTVFVLVPGSAPGVDRLVGAALAAPGRATS